MKLLAAALLAFAAPLALAADDPVPAAVTAALADPGRPAEDVARDADRHPGEVLAFMGVKPGDKVADFIMGGGYWTRILAPLVGAEGHVYAYNPAEFAVLFPKTKDAQAAATAPYANVTAVGLPLGSVSFPEPLDAIITVQNWHDLHLASFPPQRAESVAARLFDALKPGGVLLVIDHVANADPDMTAPDALHRIDPAKARAEIEAAGFKFDGQSALLANPDDPHTAKVFDPAIRGHTDQFIYRFRKPD